MAQHYPPATSAGPRQIIANMEMLWFAGICFLMFVVVYVDDKVKRV
jgi:hypothetical protein